MKRLFHTFVFTLVAGSVLLISAHDAQAWSWGDDDDWYWDRPWYGGGPWYGGYGGPYGGPYGGGYGGYPYGGYGDPYGGYQDPYVPVEPESAAPAESTPQGAPDYPPYRGDYRY